jgi:hypothetical protein
MQASKIARLELHEAQAGLKWMQIEILNEIIENVPSWLRALRQENT